MSKVARKIARFMLWFVTQAILALALLCAAAFGEVGGWWLVAALVLGGIYGGIENLRGYYDGLHRKVQP